MPATHAKGGARMAALSKQELDRRAAHARKIAKFLRDEDADLLEAYARECDTEDRKDVKVPIET
jgi:hypothetical protein